jgi:hypothetical protein
MGHQITKIRLAMAALFVLAGVGLASLLSPLIGNALATVGQVVNVSDPTLANTAKVDGSGALKVAGTATAVPVLPGTPWSNEGAVYPDGFRVLLGSQVGGRRLVVSDLTMSSLGYPGDARELVEFHFYRSPTKTTTCPSTGPDVGWTEVGAKSAAIGTPLDSKELTFPTGWTARGTSAADQVVCLYGSVSFPDSTIRGVLLQATGFVQ